MKVTVARHAGFCFGVKRALDLVLAAQREATGPIHTLGPLIHNPQVVARLEEEGVRPLASLADASPGSTVVIPSHGGAPELAPRAAELGLRLLDATCPFVAQAHAYTAQLAGEGYQVVILGDQGHPEVMGLLGQAAGKASLVSDEADLDRLPLTGRKVGLVSQTTQTPAKLQAVAARLVGACHELRVFNTICAATSQRQAGALELAAQVDMMIVVGGRNSANTARLRELCSGLVRTEHVETAAELSPDWFAGVARVGVTAGASTPDWIIREVVASLSQLA